MRLKSILFISKACNSNILRYHDKINDSEEIYKILKIILREDGYIVIHIKEYLNVETMYFI